MMYRSRFMITEGRRVHSVSHTLSSIRKTTVSCFSSNTPQQQNTGMEKFKLPARFGAGEPSVWVEYIELVAQVKPAVNLGQGFSDDFPPKHLSKALTDVANSDNPLLQQYTRGFGHPRLVKALSRLYSPLIGHCIDPLSEVLIGSGAYESLYCAILGHVEVGDEVIVIEPFFDCYDVMIKMAGGVPKFIPLKPTKTSGTISSADWKVDEQELASLFGPKTKMILINTPNNPLGKVWTLKELEFVADLCKKHNVLCVADEVYEFMIYEPMKHIRIASLPDMWERTITIGSAGKALTVTGWKTGWAYGPAPLLRNMQVVHQNCVYTHCTPIQEAIARAIEFELERIESCDCYFVSIARDLVTKRDFLLQSLVKNGFKPTVPDGGFFIVADWSDLEKKIDLSKEKDTLKDYRFTKALTRQVGVVAIPPSAFYSGPHKKLGENYARFCFMKKDVNLQLADKLITEWNCKE